jgi:hypothetical protein
MGAAGDLDQVEAEGHVTITQTQPRRDGRSCDILSGYAAGHHDG